ncbi:UDP-N-acetylmuramoyl-tripeptide--D-alanyl-D-alanine ligase [Clostridium sp. UBA4548]|uniref:UDP-N-acetylmuramoyl-tripeptide--D-alanyl-D- alanine ligase n=1 Tax=Clostridium sp. UBA4548 TaxID=1946361 RepID=UPI0025B7E561|nr:UDP-N-acetylmuramoyl-tripeptide--D-alanyl-D-alanine ligase [Clostridium sp. UBA4548]
METITLKDVVKGVKGEVLKEGKTTQFNRVSIDSRKVCAGDIFFALVGENFDGHSYIDMAIKSGAHLCIVHKKNLNLSGYAEEVSIIYVEDTRTALLDLAEHYREKLKLKVIGITGSTGKTSTKDLVAAALSEKYKVFKTKGNFNNEVGLPLMVFSLDNSYDVAILEMGMSSLGEIERLAKVAKPDIGIITNIGLSHIENLKTRDNILKAKMEITSFFNEKNVLIINGDNDMLHNLQAQGYKIIKIGLENDYNFVGSRIIIDNDHIKFNVIENGKETESSIEVGVPGKHNVLNSLLAIAVARELGLTYDEISIGIRKLEFTSMRLDIINCGNYIIINDAYNASPDSMEAALEVLKNYEGKRKIAVLGTMKELGNEAYNSHERVGSYAKKCNVDLLLTAGEFNEAFKSGFGDGNLVSFHTGEELLDFLSTTIEDGDVILVKASRTMKFEHIVSGIQRTTV